jgi:glucokinase
MSQGYPRLLGDVGGTTVRWAWQDAAGAPLRDVSVTRRDTSPSIYDSAIQYIATLGHKRPRDAGIGVATAVTGDQVNMTNGAWSFSISQLKQMLGLERCLVINDFTALAMSLPALGAADLRGIGSGVAVKGAPIALLGPGTGLGVSGLLPDAGGAVSALSGEGGHVTLAAADSDEAAILALLRKRFSHVSAERVLSGMGLVNLYGAVCALRGVQMTDLNLNPAQITEAALAKADAASVQTLQLFASFLGNVAGNLVLTLGARGGLFVGGGIVPKMGAAFDAELFRRRFEAKGRFEEYLQTIPAWIITAPTPALLGVSLALDSMAD